MTYQPQDISSETPTLPKQPGWVTSGRLEPSENVAFLSGARFAMLDVILTQSGESMPKDLLRNTLALKTAVATSKLEGRMARETDMRDAFFLTAPDQDGICHWGPDGDMLDFWRKAVRINLKSQSWVEDVAVILEPNIADVVDELLPRAIESTQTSGPLSSAVAILKAVIEIDDRAEKTACLLSDVVLAKFFGWERVLPLTALHLTKANLRDLRNDEMQSDKAIQIAISQSAETAFYLSKHVITHANALRAVAPKLRAKGSDEAVALFLKENAVAPSGMLSPHIKGTRTLMTSRAARRLCDRLVELGVVKELTGRPTFRLYGIAS